jgi:predicted nucleic acid-binding protein
MPTNLFLVDTSVWIFALRKQFIPSIKERVSELLRDHVVLTSGMIKLEILGGAKTEKEFQRLKTRFDALDSVETNTSLWEKAYALAFTLRRKGVSVPSTDILIAACALTTESTLVHADAHFDVMAKHSALTVESFVRTRKNA